VAEGEGRKKKNVWEMVKGFARSFARLQPQTCVLLESHLRACAEVADTKKEYEKEPGRLLFTFVLAPGEGAADAGRQIMPSTDSRPEPEHL
jgi:hypothetical protein